MTIMDENWFIQVLICMSSEHLGQKWQITRARRADQPGHSIGIRGERGAGAGLAQIPCANLRG